MAYITQCGLLESGGHGRGASSSFSTLDGDSLLFFLRARSFALVRMTSGVSDREGAEVPHLSRFGRFSRSWQLRPMGAILENNLKSAGLSRCPDTNSSLSTARVSTTASILQTAQSFTLLYTFAPQSAIAFYCRGGYIRKCLHTNGVSRYPAENAKIKSELKMPTGNLEKDAARKQSALPATKAQRLVSNPLTDASHAGH